MRGSLKQFLKIMGRKLISLSGRFESPNSQLSSDFVSTLALVDKLEETVHQSLRVIKKPAHKPVKEPAEKPVKQPVKKPVPVARKQQPKVNPQAFTSKDPKYRPALQSSSTVDAILSLRKNLPAQESPEKKPPEPRQKKSDESGFRRAVLEEVKFKQKNSRFRKNIESAPILKWE